MEYDVLRAVCSKYSMVYLGDEMIREAARRVGVYMIGKALCSEYSMIYLEERWESK